MVLKILDLLFPPLCVSCRDPVGEAGFCATCWSKLVFLDGPACACCGTPFAVAIADETLCAACLAKPPAFDRARAILAFKHADRLDLVPGFARWLERAGRNLLADTDLIVPVPLHPLRLWKRRYNQAAELARALGRRTDCPVDPLALVRARATPSQGSMASARARRRNVRSAFRVPDGRKAGLAGRNILLVDDVLTTGATAEAAARALKRAGAAQVQVLALARVVRATELLI